MELPTSEADGYIYKVGCVRDSADAYPKRKLESHAVGSVPAAELEAGRVNGGERSGREGDKVRRRRAGTAPSFG